jgi:flavin-dependent dehydrogenase
MCALIAIIGAGPAGCAAAITLRRYLPEVDVMLISKVAANSARVPAVGESLSPGVFPLLDYLGLKQQFLRLGNLSSWSTASAWGSHQVFERDYLFVGLGSGWQIDRSKFDAWLIEVAQRAGVRWIQARARRAAYDGERWSIELDGENRAEADSIVDATGRTAWLARSQGVVPQRDDALVAEARWYARSESESRVAGVLVETTEYGWWYSSTLPDGRGVAMFMTDSDLRSNTSWHERLAGAPTTSARLTCWRPTGEYTVRAAHSQKSGMVVGKGWVSAGDAAVAFDPVSSLGIGFSLRSGIEAARVAVAAAEKDDSQAMAFEASVGGIYADYRRRLRRIYCRERRWPTALFWVRRQSVDRCAADAANQE